MYSGRDSRDSRDNLQAFTTCKPQLFHVHDTLDCTLHLFGLTFFLEILFLLQNKLFIPSNWYYIPGIVLSWINPKLISLALC